MNDRVSPRLLRLPGIGSLLFCTDLHGNLRDFLRMQSLFVQANACDGGAHLLFCGDLIHGPAFPADGWPSYLGSYYADESPAVVAAFMALQAEFPGRVHCLLGNHEHSHIGGPHTPKFWADETAYFEGTIGPEVVEICQKLFNTFPLVAHSPCGVVFTHAAPNVDLSDAEELEQILYSGHESMNFLSGPEMPLIGRLLWARHCPAHVASAFLDALSEDGRSSNVVAFGHDIIATGFERRGGNQLIVSSSFGLENHRKCYLRLDLAARYSSSEDLRWGHEILPLYRR